MFTKQMIKPYSKPSFANEAFREWYLPSGIQCLGYMPFSVAKFLIRKGLFWDNGLRLELKENHEQAGGLTTALEKVREALWSEGLIVEHRNEVMDVLYRCDAEPIATIDRSALRILGLWATKVHVNGVIKTSESSNSQIWLSQRSDAANAAPGHWDTLVAGGKASNVSTLETAVKEGWEEAGISKELMSDIALRNLISCVYLSPQGMHRELLVSYDLELPRGFEPICNDDEVQDFKRVDSRTLTSSDGKSLPMKFSSKLVLTSGESAALN
jgi:8-oxo-dGTP pyrophosphatase MutT (NUDIX family)